MASADRRTSNPKPRGHAEAAMKSGAVARTRIGAGARHARSLLGWRGPRAHSPCAPRAVYPSLPQLRARSIAALRPVLGQLVARLRDEAAEGAATEPEPPPSAPEDAEAGAAAAAEEAAEAAGEAPPATDPEVRTPCIDASTFKALASRSGPALCVVQLVLNFELGRVG